MTLIFNNNFSQEFSLVGTGSSSILDYIFTLPLVSRYYFYLKVVFILFLFGIHMYFLLFNDESILKDLEYKESGLANLKRILKEQSVYILTLGGYYAAILNADTAKLNKEIIIKQIESQKVLEKVAELEVEKTEAVDKLKIIFGGVKKFTTKVEQIKINQDESKASLKDIKSQNDSAEALAIKLANTSDESERRVILSEYLTVTAKRKHELESLESHINKTKDLTNDMDALKEDILKDQVSTSLPSPAGGEGKDNNNPKNTEDLTKDSDINKSSIFNMEWYNELDLVKQIAVLLILSQSIVISALLSIIYIYYGQILIDKFNLENKYPKLATIIKYRKQFSKYYFLHSCVMITAVSLSQIGFAIGILSI